MIEAKQILKKLNKVKMENQNKVKIAMGLTMGYLK